MTYLVDIRSESCSFSAGALLSSVGRLLCLHFHPGMNVDLMSGFSTTRSSHDIGKVGNLLLNSKH